MSNFMSMDWLHTTLKLYSPKCSKLTIGQTIRTYGPEIAKYFESAKGSYESYLALFTLLFEIDGDIYTILFKLDFPNESISGLPLMGLAYGSPLKDKIAQMFIDDFKEQKFGTRFDYKPITTFHKNFCQCAHYLVQAHKDKYAEIVKYMFDMVTSICIRATLDPIETKLERGKLLAQMHTHLSHQDIPGFLEVLAPKLIKSHTVLIGYIKEIATCSKGYIILRTFMKQNPKYVSTVSRIIHPKVSAVSCELSLVLFLQSCPIDQFCTRNIYQQLKDSLIKIEFEHQSSLEFVIASTYMASSIENIKVLSEYATKNCLIELNKECTLLQS